MLISWWPLWFADDFDYANFLADGIDMVISFWLRFCLCLFFSMHWFICLDSDFKMSFDCNRVERRCEHLEIEFPWPVGWFLVWFDIQSGDGERRADGMSLDGFFFFCPRQETPYLPSLRAPIYGRRWIIYPEERSGANTRIRSGDAVVSTWFAGSDANLSVEMSCWLFGDKNAPQMALAVTSPPLAAANLSVVLEISNGSNESEWI